VDGNGNPVPWYTYPAIEFLDRLDFSESTVFEYGSGNSSLWWSGRSHRVISVESDAEWHGRISAAAQSMSNFDYRLAKGKEDYVLASGLANADVVVIDGKYRFECARHLIDGLGTGALRAKMIIFDNSDWYPRSIFELSKRLGWTQVDFAGFGPINDYTWTTSVFLAPGQDLTGRRSRPLGSISGMTKVAGDD
jgi:hypothetical protein